MRYLFASWLDFLLIFVPATVALEFLRADPLLIFLSAGLAIVPLAGLLGRATEHLTTHVGAGIGALLNASLGNAAELIIALVALREGLHDVVKASLTGSIIGNILLIFGLSILAGGFRFKEQRFSRENTGIQSSMLLIAIIGLAVPTILVTTVLSGAEHEGAVQLLSDSLAVILIIVYALGIVFTFFTHKHLFVTHEAPTTAEGAQQEDVHAGHWSKKKSFLLLAASMAGVIVVSEILVASVEQTGEELGFGELFHLRRSLVGNFFDEPVKHPTRVAGIRLNATYAGGGELRAFTIGIGDVIQELHRDLRDVLFKFRVEALADNGLDIQVGLPAENFNRAIDYFLRLLVNRVGRLCFRESKTR